MPRNEERVLARDAGCRFDDGSEPTSGGAASGAAARAAAFSSSAKEGVVGTSIDSDGARRSLGASRAYGLIAAPPSLVEWCSDRPKLSRPRITTSGAASAAFFGGEALCRTQPAEGGLGGCERMGLLAELERPRGGCRRSATPSAGPSRAGAGWPEGSSSHAISS